MAHAARDEWALRYRMADQPSRIRLAGVELVLRDEWASPAIRQAIYEGWYELPERTILERTLRPDDRYLEAGAGIGLVTTCACMIVGARNVIAYEADPRLAEQARETAARNGFAAEVVNAALGARDGEVAFHTSPDFWASSLLPSPGAQEVRVPVRSFGDVLDAFRPTYLMIDIEGGEVELLAPPLPDHVRAVCVETHPRVVDAEALQAMLLSLMATGFRLDLHESREGVAFLAREAGR